MLKETRPNTATPRASADASASPPAELDDFLRQQRYACVTQATNRGTAYIVKTPDSDVATLTGSLPIWVRHQLYEHPSAPVIRTVIRLYDRPRTPLCLESFINIADKMQRAEFAGLAAQERLLFLFYDERSALRVQKSVAHSEAQRRGAAEILESASSYLATISPAQFDFDKAKAAVMAATDI